MWHKRYTCGGTSYPAITSLNCYTESLKLKSDLYRQFSLSSLMLNITLKLQWVFTYHIPLQSLFSFFRTFKNTSYPSLRSKICEILDVYHILENKKSLSYCVLSYLKFSISLSYFILSYYQNIIIFILSYKIW